MAGGGDGVVLNGASSTITHSSGGLGSALPTYSTLGGTSGIIESGTSGVTPANSGGWIFDQGVGTNATVSTAHARSGTKSLFWSLNDSTQFNGALRYDYGSAINAGEKLYVSWWVRRTHVGDGQWKMFRVNWQNDIQDDYHQFAMFNWYNQDLFILRGGNPVGGSYDTTDYGPPYPAQDSRWYRMEIEATLSSVNGTDGSYDVRLHDPSGGGPIASNITAGMSYQTDTRKYRWFIWQNYNGNGQTASDVWIDDPFIQVGSFARVELADSATWSSRTFSEIQYPTAWSDTGITFTYNKGGFGSGATAYAHVVRADGSTVYIDSVTIP